MARARSEARKTIASATSAASTRQRIGVSARILSTIAASLSSFCVRSVRTQAGATAFTRMPCAAHSTASARVMLTMAPLVAWYDRFGYGPPPDRPMIDATLTIAPRPAGSIARAAARQQTKTAVWFKSTTVCQSATDNSSVGRRSAMPALLTRMSMRP